MIKKQQKWIALLVVCTFMWLMQVSTMPVAAAGTTEQISSAGAEQGPDYYEAVSQKAAPAKKKSMLPIILIGVGLLTVTAAVLILVVFKTKYDITGAWALTYNFGGSDGHDVNTFAGTKKSGTFTAALTAGGGTYTVNGKNVSWIFNDYPHTNYIGTFTSKDAMSGTMSNEGGGHGTWYATRQGSSPAALSPSRTGPDANGR
jgi:hypothetical protein